MNVHVVNAVVSPEDLGAVLSFLPQLEAPIPERIWSREPKTAVDEMRGGNGQYRLKYQ